MIRRFLVLLFSFVCACSLTTSLDGLSGGPIDPSIPDASFPPADGNVSKDVSIPPVGDDDASTSDGGETVSPNLYAAGNFESPTSDLCSGGAYHSLLSQESPGRNFSFFACQVCATGTGTDLYTIDKFTSVVPKAGDHYRATAWVAKPQGSTAPTSVFIALRGARADPFQVFDEKSGDPVVLDEQYRQVTVDLKITQDAPSIEYFVGTNFVKDTCFLLDDVQIFKVTP